MRVEQARTQIAEEAEAVLAEQLEGMKSELVERVDALKFGNFQRKSANV